ncbi:unnamed protein product [Rhodiola kirilowii]
MASASFIETNPLNWNRIPSLLPHLISHATCKSRLVFIRNPKNSRPSFTLKCVLSKLPNNELSASGGRMGGSSFSSQSSSSSRSYSTRSPGPSFSYSVPRRRSYSSRSPGPSFSYSAPYYAPSPFGGVVGFCVELTVFSVVFFGLLAGASLFLVFVVAFVWHLCLYWNDARSVMKLQVGLGMGRSLQKDLNRISEVADTSTPKGLRYVLTETALALLRHPDYCISGYSSVDVKRSMDEVEERFNQLSIEERGKFDEETLVNVNDIRRQSSTSQRSSGFSNEYMVVTILVTAKGVHKLPSINGSKDLKEALQKLASIPASKTLAVEVLCTPRNENAVLSSRELLEDYPLLRPL